MSESKTRVRLSNKKFIEICERVAAEGGGVEEIAAETGYSEKTVPQKRSQINAMFKEAGVETRLTPLPRGGGGSKDTVSDLAKMIEEAKNAAQSATAEADVDADVEVDGEYLNWSDV